MHILLLKGSTKNYSLELNGKLIAYLLTPSAALVSRPGYLYYCYKYVRFTVIIFLHSKKGKNPGRRQLPLDMVFLKNNPQFKALYGVINTCICLKKF